MISDRRVTAAVWYAVLGPVRAWRAGAELDLGRPQQQALLAVLLVQAGRPVGLTELIDVLWGEQPPASAVNLVHRYVGQLRRLFEPDLSVREAGRWLVRTGAGYRLAVESESVDLLEFRQLADRARQTSRDVGPARAVPLFAEALDRWQGPCAANLEPEVREHPLFRAVDREYVTTVQELADAALASADIPGSVLATVRQAAAAEPWDEPLQARLMLMLAATGRQAEALAVFQDTRVRLADELGLDPGPELRAAHERVLRQEVEPETPAEAARPARAPDAPAQLPPDLPTFTGRRDELASALALVPRDGPPASTVVICAIDGMAGIGKTTLAVHWAHLIADRFPDGQLYVNLRGFDPGGTVLEPAEAVIRFLEALGVPPGRIPAGLDAQAALYRSTLAGRRVLVLLDNARDVEHVRPLLPGSPGCLVIVTSRNRLASLVARDGAQPLPLGLPSLAEARAAIARRLGADRVAAEPAAVDEIIAACGRLPLAIAIVAARAVVNPGFSLAELAAELRDTAGSLDAFADVDPSTDARAAFSWSYRALSESAARLFRLLALHPGPEVSAPVAASVAGVADRQARPLLAELTSAHLLVERTPGRYASHDLIRAYAAELVDADPEPERQMATQRGFDRYVYASAAANRLIDPTRAQITLLEPLAGVTPTGPTDYAGALTWFAAEYANLLAAIRAAARDGYETHAWQLTWALQHFLDRRGHWHEWLAIQRVALDAARRLPDRTGEAHTARGMGVVCSRLRRDDEAREHLHRALELFAELGDPIGQAHVHLLLGSVEMRRPAAAPEDAALRHAEQALELYTDAGDRLGQARTLNNLGYYHGQMNNHAASLGYAQRALALHQALGDPHGEANAWDTVGWAHFRLGEPERAIACYERSVAMFEELSDLYYATIAMDHLGDVYQQIGDRPAAERHWRRALDILEDLDHTEAPRVRAKLDPAGSGPPA
jgi:DNA-binding SARP family transcriptional activator/tetratricopeptide (TPR) repeat protein